METIGEKIRRIRKSKGISQIAVADTCNIKQSSFANIESGKTQNITIEIGKGIANALNVSFNELFEIEDLEQTVSDIENLLSEKNAKIADLQKQIEQKDLLIDLLKSDNQRIKNDIIKYIKLIADYQIYALINFQSSLMLTNEQKTEIQKNIIDIIHLFGFQQFVETGIISNSEMQQIVNKNWEIWKNSENE